MNSSYLGADPGHLPVRPHFSIRTLMCVLIGLSIGLNFEIIGRITGSELLILIFLPIMVVMRRIPPLPKPMQHLLFLSVVWFCAQLISDIVNESSIANLARGSARALMTGALLIGYYSLGVESRKRLTILFTASAIGLVIGYFYDPSELAIGNPWKFGYGRTVTMLGIVVAGILWSMRLPLLSVGVCLSMVAVNLLLGFRSIAGITFMVALGVSMAPFLVRWFPGGAMWRVLLASMMLILGAGVIVEIYEYVAIEGFLGEDEQMKLFEQTNSYGLLLSGRAEIFVSSQAIFDRPILGHGSWATSDYYYDIFMEHLGYGSVNLPDIPNSIPTHSYLFGAWTEGGIFSAAFWFYVLTLLFRAFTKILRQPSLIHPILLFCLFDLSWNVFFSPYGLDGRVNACFQIVVLTTLLSAPPTAIPSKRVLHPLQTKAAS